MVVVSNNLPVLSTTATLTPVRKPGSKPIVLFAPAGAAIKSAVRFLAKTSMASSSAFSRKLAINSVSKCNETLIFHVHAITCSRHLSAGCPVKRTSK